MSKKWQEFLVTKREELVYNCLSCHGRSQVCECRIAYSQYSSLYSAGIPFSMRNFSRETIEQIDSKDPLIAKMKEAWLAVYDRVDYVKKNGINLFVYGDSGAGKTMCASILVKEAAKHGFISQYITFPSLVSAMLHEEDRKDAIFNIDFLIIDDIKQPAEIMTDKAIALYSSILEQVFLHRFEQELPTILMADSTLNEVIDSYNLQRIKSSLTSKRTKRILHVGKDYRKDGDLHV